MFTQRTCIRILTGLFVMVALSACDRSVDLRFKAQPGDKRVFQVTRDFKISGPDMMGESDSQQNTSRATYTYEVTGAGDAGNTQAKVTGSLADLAGNDTLAPIIAAIMEEGPAMLAEMGLPMGENPFADQGDVELTVEIDPAGALASVSGMDETGEKRVATVKQLFKEQMGAQQEQMQQMLTMMGVDAAGFMQQMEALLDKPLWQLRKAMSNQAAIMNLRFLTDVLPAETVQVGSTWKKDSETMFPPAFVFETFTVTDRAGGVCTLKYEANLTPRSDNSIDLGIVRLTFQVEGTKTGTIQVDEQTGWVKAATINVKQSANVSVKRDLSSLGPEMAAMLAMLGLGDMDDIPFNMEGTVHVESGLD